MREVTSVVITAPHAVEGVAGAVVGVGEEVSVGVGGLGGGGVSEVAGQFQDRQARGEGGAGIGVAQRVKGGAVGEPGCVDCGFEDVLVVVTAAEQVSAGGGDQAVVAAGDVPLDVLFESRLDEGGHGDGTAAGFGLGRREFGMSARAGVGADLPVDAVGVVLEVDAGAG